MKTDLRLALSTKYFVFLLISSALLRLIFQFIVLADHPSEFGPDEGTYAALAGYVATSSPVEDFPAYGPGLYNSARSFIIPSSLLVRLGINELDSVRLISSLYGICGLLLFFICVIAIKRFYRQVDDFHIAKLDFKQKVYFAIYTFLPSYFLWSNLGLRESASQFFVMLTFYFLIKVSSCSRYARAILVIFASISLMLAFGARKETALLFSICALILGLFVMWRVRNYSVVTVVVVGFILGQFFTTTPVVEAKEVTTVFKYEGKELKPIAQKPELLDICKLEAETVNYNDESFVCVRTKQYANVESNPIASTQKLILTAQVLEYKRNVNRLNASSALPESKCNSYSNIALKMIRCDLKELPYRLFAFLFRPFPILDSGSNFLNLAGLENVLWLCIVSLASLQLFQTRKTNEYRMIKNFLSSFLLSFSVAASLYEGNLGTAFRHKSTILWLVMLLLILTYRPANTKLESLSTA